MTRPRASLSGVLSSDSRRHTTPTVQAPPYRVSSGRSIRAARILLTVEELGLPSSLYRISKNGELFPESCRQESGKRRGHGWASHTKRKDDIASHRIASMPLQPYWRRRCCAGNTPQPQHQDVFRSLGRLIV